MIRNLEIDSVTKKRKVQLGTMVEDQLVWTFEQSPENFLKEELGEESTDFYVVKQMVAVLGNNENAWKEFIKNCRIENGELVTVGIHKNFDNKLFIQLDGKSQAHLIEKINKKIISIGWNNTFGGKQDGLQPIMNNKVIPGNLALLGGDCISLNKVETIDLSLIVSGNQNLVDLGNLSYVHGEIFAEGSNVELQIKISEKIRNKDLSHGSHRVMLGGRTDNLNQLFQQETICGNVNLEGTEIVDLGITKEIKGIINCFGLKELSLNNLNYTYGIVAIDSGINLQYDILERVNSGKLNLLHESSFGGNIEGIEKLLEFDFIPGDLDLKGTSKEVQSKFKEKVLSKKMKVDGDVFFDGKVIPDKNRQYW